ncbi:MAG: methylated-DNA--[protein]-cysteine S-methyltransferase [Verrucomicrobiales bacterium]|nr:methylated-DNA--[protein]-cysteine S-methyltransferase [Verrucomicrobiales bacterium]MCP5557539.1 methylated-DNA--[protein]-cysteine S-methyltransferase [Verrucomicrobiaceae bacterium]
MKTIYKTTWQSPLGLILLAATERGLCGCWFIGQKHFPAGSDAWSEDVARLQPAIDWLTGYFQNATSPSQAPLIDWVGGTDFQRSVWSTLQQIPAGKTLSYGQIAAKLGRPAASRAVGAAVGRNPISLIVPCHRVVGGNGSLTGYAGGLERKQWLLAHEKAG